MLRLRDGWPSGGDEEYHSNGLVLYKTNEALSLLWYDRHLFLDLLYSLDT